MSTFHSYLADQRKRDDWVGVIAREYLVVVESGLRPPAVSSAELWPILGRDLLFRDFTVDHAKAIDRVREEWKATL